MTVLLKLPNVAAYKGATSLQTPTGVPISDRVQDSEREGRKAVKFLSKPTDHIRSELRNRTEALIGKNLGYVPKDGDTDYTGFGLWIPKLAMPYESDFVTFWQYWPQPETTYFGLGWGDDRKLGLTGAPERYDPPLDRWSEWLITIKHSKSGGAGYVQVEVDGKVRFLATRVSRIGPNGAYQKHGLYKGVKSRDGKRTFPDCHMWIADYTTATSRAEAVTKNTPADPPAPPPDAGIEALRAENAALKAKIAAAQRALA